MNRFQTGERQNSRNRFLIHEDGEVRQVAEAVNKKGAEYCPPDRVFALGAERQFETGRLGGRHLA